MKATAGAAKNGKEASRAGAEPTKDKRKALVERQLMEQACILFAKKGYPGTTLADIADAVGLTRAAVYYYFRNKEALLEAIVNEVSESPMRDIAEWRKTAPTNSRERLHSFVVSRVRGLLSRQIQMRMIEVTEAALPDELLERHTAAKRKVLDEYRSILRDGMKSGEFRVQDDRVAAFGIIGIVNWTATWFAPDRGLSVDQVADQLADMAVHSVGVTTERGDESRGPQAILQSVREDLDQLSLLIAESGKST